MKVAVRSTANRRFAVAAIAACAAFHGCGTATDPPVVILVSGDTSGWIVPCGCASNQSGGLPRRATYAEAACQDATVVLADAGGAGQGTSAYDQLKLAAILRGEKAMGVAAHNIGASEAALGPEVLRRIAQETGTPLLSTNVCDREGASLAEPTRIVRAGKLRILFLGVLAERHADGKLQIAPPVQAVRAALGTLQGKFDTSVLLAYLPEDELSKLAEAIPELDIVCGGPTGQPLVPQTVGPVVLASATYQGKFLARFDAIRSGSRTTWRGSVVQLDSRYADDPQQTANVAEFYCELARRDFSPTDTSFAPRYSAAPASDRVAGDDRCQACHEEDFRIWKKSKHAHAWASLEAKGAHVNPDCQRCHTTGYGQPDGFAGMARSKARIGVGCESCHGPSLAHANNEKIPTPFRGLAANHCGGCHDRENSPKFAFDAYWKQIQHGPSQSENPASATAVSEAKP